LVRRWRAPDLLLSDRGETATFKFRRALGGRIYKVRLPVQAPAAEAVALLVGTMLPVRTDLSGRLTGWYRLADARGCLPSMDSLSGLGADAILDLEFVENTVVSLEIEVRTATGSLTLRTQVGNAVPMASLTDHLASLFDLPEGDWRVLFRGRQLNPYEILADLEPRDGERIVVMKA